MYRFKNVLFSPLGDHENPAALRRVTELVERNDGRLTLLGVAATPSRLQRMLSRPGIVDGLLESEVVNLDKTLQRWDEQGSIDAEVNVEVGDPALKIIECVIAHGHDLVVVTSDEDREDRSTIRRLLRKCPCPVWVVRPTRARTQRVLAAVNPDPGEAELNRTILQLASSMVRLHGGELHVVHAWALFGEAKMRSSAFMHFPRDEIDELVEEERSSHDRCLTELLDSTLSSDDAPQVHLLKGSPATVVPELVTNRRINLLVLGTVARTGVNAMVMGNTAECILDRVDCSVIAVKPPGFVSPIGLAPA